MGKIKTLPEEIFFYEKCAAEANNITMREMFLGGRMRDAVMARYFSLWFMINRLKKTLTPAGARYGLDHATVLHGLKSLEINAERKDTFAKELDDRFIEFKAKVIHTYLAKEQSAFMDKIHREINEKGLREFLVKISSDLNTLSFCLLSYHKNGSRSLENDIVEKSINCSNNIEKLKSLFSHDS